MILKSFIIFLCLSFVLTIGKAQTANKPDSTKRRINLVVKSEMIFNYLNADRFIKTRHQKNPYKKAYYSFTIEKLFNRQHSLQLTYVGFSRDDFAKSRWFVITPEYKYFVSKKGKYSGYYVGGGLKYLNTLTEYNSWYSTATNSSFTVINHHVGAQFINGVQFYLWKRIAVDLFAAPGVYWKVSREKKIPPYYSTMEHTHYWYSLGYHTDLRLGINMGFRF